MNGFPLSRILNRRFFFGSFGAGIIACSGFGWIGSEKFVVPNRRALEPRHEAALKAPEEFGFELSEAYSVTAGDGIALSCRLISPAKHPGAAVKTRRMRQRLGAGTSVRSTVVMLHGRGGIKEDAFPVAERFVAAGFRCLIFDARAHGVSGGDFTTYGAKEVGDLRAVLDDAETRFGHETLGPFVGFGISLGAAVLLQALPEEPRLRSAVVVAPFADLPTVAQRSVANVIHPAMPRFLTGMVTTVGGIRAGFSPELISPVESAARIRVPVMVAHGDRDRVIPMAEGRRVFEALPENGINRWRPVPGGRHGDVLAVGNDDLYQEMIEFWIANLGSN
ncbi:MAG: alpha/beta fold hydrolase [Verrucomicrobiae bacterium]|nr:alpha/beta fold hydrolase [Verrucomicrobiae bacterium]